MVVQSIVMQNKKSLTLSSGLQFITGLYGEMSFFNSYVQESKRPPDASSAPIAQLLSFPDRYNEHLNSGSHSSYSRGGPPQTPPDDMKHVLQRGHGSRPAGIFHPAHHHPYTTAPQYQYAMYPGVKGPDSRRYHYHNDPPIW